MNDWSESIININKLLREIQGKCNAKCYTEAIDIAFDINIEVEALRWSLYDIKHPASASARQHL